MGTLLQDISRVGPAPTVKRETSALLLSLALAVPVLIAFYIVFDETRTLTLGLGGALILWLFGRWGFAAMRGDRE